MVNWTRICRSKKKGGLGVKNLHRQNVSLLCKWWWKLETQTGLWQSIVSAKYLRNKIVASVTSRVTDSPCWKALMKVKDTYFAGRNLILKKGNLVRFWKDPWLDGCSLCVSYPSLFDICQAQDWTFEKGLECNFSLPFRRRFLPAMETQWEYIVSCGKIRAAWCCLMVLVS